MEMKKHMLYKNTIKLLFLFIILLVSISAISAVDNSTDVTQEMGFNEVMAHPRPWQYPWRAQHAFSVQSGRSAPDNLPGRH